jgi:HTH-like domain
MTHRYRFISEHHASYGVTRLCRILAVPRRQGYCEWLAAQPARAKRAAAEDEPAAEIRTIHSAHNSAYDSLRVAVELRRRGRQVNRKRVVWNPVGHTCVSDSMPTGGCSLFATRITWTSARQIGRIRKSSLT